MPFAPAAIMQILDDVFISFHCVTLSKMADNAGKVANMARILAIVHIIVGFLLICFGIADRAVEYFWTGYGCYGIWIGVWVSNACTCVYFHADQKSVNV